MAPIKPVSGRMNPIKWLDKSFQKDPVKALAYTTVASIIIKDGVGCYKYVTQSLNNKEIPEKRRNFVAALDLTNGILMIIAQIGMFAAMRKYSEPIFNKLFKKSFNPKVASQTAERIRMQQKQAGETVSRKIEINKKTQEVRKNALEAFKFVAEIAAATIVGKRIIVPFIATPLANIVKDKMEAKNKEKAEAEAENNISSKNVIEQKEEVKVQEKTTREVDDDDDEEDDD